MVDTRAHWEAVYHTKREHEVSWFRQDQSMSLALLERAGIAQDT